MVTRAAWQFAAVLDLPANCHAPDMLPSPAETGTGTRKLCLQIVWGGLWTVDHAEARMFQFRPLFPRN